MRASLFRLKADRIARPTAGLLRSVAGIRVAFAATLVTVWSLSGCDPAETPRSMLLATTTSVRDSGLLDALLPEFTQRTGIEVRVIAVGSGAALRMGREGDADLLLTHAPTAEQVLVDAGIVRRRTPFMENHFVIAGPAVDPAGIKAMSTPEAALQAIARSQAAWVSRADDSGTHKREVALWKAAGLSPEASWEGLLHTGSGMGLSLQVAGEKRAYILTDIGTFLAFRERVDLVSLSTPSESLRNVYSLLQLDASNFDYALKTEEAEALERHLLSPDTQRRIGIFGQQRFGRAVFVPLHLRPDESA
ncbi:MAG: substrate-binding domain-containing protein [Deltaproteobacteria bacterium]|nr:substrate-binding domain-containing protein [Deltaproteobacteria bacterium]